MDRSFPAKFRIKKRGEFLRIQEKGQKFHTKHFLIIVSKSYSDNCRFGPVVTRKVDKRAAVRNKIKRRLKEIFRLHKSRFTQTVDLVIVARNNAGEITFAEMRKQVLGTLKSKGLLKTIGGEK